MFWSHSFEDLTTLVSLKSQEHMARHLQTYESFRLVVGEVLGGTESSSATDDNKPIGTFEELARAFEQIGGALG